MDDVYGPKCTNDRFLLGGVSVSLQYLDLPRCLLEDVVEDLQGARVVNTLPLGYFGHCEISVLGEVVGRQNVIVEISLH